MQSCMTNPPDENPHCFWGDVPIDEWTYCEKLRAMGAANAAEGEDPYKAGEALLSERLKEHWDTWVSGKRHAGT